MTLPDQLATAAEVETWLPRVWTWAAARPRFDADTERALYDLVGPADYTRGPLAGLIHGGPAPLRGKAIRPEAEGWLIPWRPNFTARLTDANQLDYAGTPAGTMATAQALTAWSAARDQLSAENGHWRSNAKLAIELDGRITEATTRLPDQSRAWLEIIGPLYDEPSGQTPIVASGQGRVSRRTPI